MMMRALITAALLLIASVASAQPQWVQSSSIYTNQVNSKHPNVVFVNSYTGAGPAAGQWAAIDLKPFGVSPDAKTAFLAGILIITHGGKFETCDLTLALRPPGSALDGGDYLGQTVETAPGSGQRSTMGTWVPLVDGVFELQWRRSTYAQWPQSCAYGINLSLQAWTR